MRRSLIAIMAFLLASTSFASAPKEWTFLIYLNGNNNLDSYGAMNINQMEKIGSTAKINVIVQWASLANGKTQRLYITKDNDTAQVTSKVVEDMGQVDMGDYKSIIEFVKWGASKYPAKHYFVDVWDHGSGWHLKPGEPMKDISWDDISGNHITTKQLATALTESSKILGQKIDIYGSDACLMAMVEIADEVKDSVSVFLGSEETEPADGWPYDTFLAGWNKLPATATAADVTKVLTKAYVEYYKGKAEDITLSAFDLNFLEPLNQSLKKFASSFKGLSTNEVSKVSEATKKSTHFSSDDYVDLGDFLDNVKALKISKLSKSMLNEVSTNMKNFVITNETFMKAQGAAIWIPTDAYTYSNYADRYSQMSFEQQTHWGDVAKLIANAK